MNKSGTVIIPPALQHFFLCYSTNTLQVGWTNKNDCSTISLKIRACLSSMI
jgi:hypothetical protein